MDEHSKENRDGELPVKNVPKWAIGFAYLSSMVISVGITAWVSVSPDFRTYLANKKETELASIAAADESNKRLTDGVLSAVGVCATQLSDLSRVMGGLAGEKDDLSRKVNSLQDEARRLALERSECEKNLALCAPKRGK